MKDIKKLLLGIDEVFELIPAVDSHLVIPDPREPDFLDGRPRLVTTKILKEIRKKLFQEIELNIPSQDLEYLELLVKNNIEYLTHYMDDKNAMKMMRQISRKIGALNGKRRKGKDRKSL